jgi:plasmid stabilization system protein ParE
MRIRVTRRADTQIDQAASWWEKIRPHAPGAIDDELVEALSLLVVQPDIGAPAVNTRTRGVRRIFLARIRYWLYYRVRDDEIAILAFWHASRGSGPGL